MITQKELKEWVSYNPETGDFTAIKKSRGRKEGSICGGINKGNGYVEICVLSNRFLSHRLIFLYMTGMMPDGEVDHLNHIKSDNRWSNLRVVDHANNQRNRPVFKNNKSGTSGVSFSNALKKWYASIQVNYKSINLGYHKELNDAIEARRVAELKYGFHKNHGK
jgi:hypothetical protein